MTRKEEKQLAEHVDTYNSWHEMKPEQVVYDTNLAILRGPGVGGKVVYLVKVECGFWVTDRFDMLSLNMRKKAQRMREGL